MTHLNNDVSQWSSTSVNDCYLTYPQVQYIEAPGDATDEKIADVKSKVFNSMFSLDSATGILTIDDTANRIDAATFKHAVKFQVNDPNGRTYAAPLPTDTHRFDMVYQPNCALATATITTVAQTQTYTLRGTALELAPPTWVFTNTFAPCGAMR